MNLNNKIKINLLFDQFPLANQMYIYNMVHQLSEEPDLDLSILSNSKKALDSNLVSETLPNYYYRRLYEKWIHSTNSKFKNLSFIEIKWIQNKVDVIHIQHSYLLNKIGNLIKIDRKNRPKIIVTLRGSDTYVKPWHYKNWQQYYKEYMPEIEAFVVQSEHQKEYLQKWGVHVQKIHVIPSSIKKSQSVSKKIKSTKIKIVSSFRMCWEKNIDSNIRVIKCLVDKGYDIEYDIYGFGPDLGQVYYLIDKYNLSKHIFVKGKVENDTYLKKLHEYDFYLQLSVLESLSISVIEAQSKGIPAIVSDSSGIIETIIPEVTGFALPYFNSELASEKIIDLVNSESRYQEFSIAAIQHVNSKFIDEIEVKKHIELYKKIIETV